MREAWPKPRIKKKMKNILGFDTNPPQQEPVAEVTPPPPPPKSTPKPTSPPQPKNESPRENTSPKKSEGDSEQKKISEDKIQRHLLRTKKGLLKFLQKEGGTTDLAALHTHSETRFLIGHQKFSC